MIGWYMNTPLSMISLFCNFSYLLSTTIQKQVSLPLTYCQKINSSLCYNPVPTSFSFHLITQTFNHLTSSQEGRVQYNNIFWERDHIHLTCSTVCYYNCSILLVVTVVNLLLCLVDKLNFSTVCIGKNIIYTFLKFQGSLGMYPQQVRGTTVVVIT